MTNANFEFLPCFMQFPEPPTLTGVKDRCRWSLASLPGRIRMLAMVVAFAMTAVNAHAYADLSARVVVEELDIVDLDPTATRISGGPVYFWVRGTSFLSESLFYVNSPGGYQEERVIDSFDRSALAGAEAGWQRNATLFTPAAATGTVSLATLEGLAFGADFSLQTDFPADGMVDREYGAATIFRNSDLGMLFLDAYSQVTLRGRIETTFAGGATAGRTASAAADWNFSMTPVDFTSDGILPIDARSETGSRQLLWGPGEQSTADSQSVAFEWTLRNDSAAMLGGGQLSVSVSLQSLEAVSPVPAPPAVWLLLSGLVIVGMTTRRRVLVGACDK